MFNFFHTFHPSAILIAIGPIRIYWYGFFIVLGSLSAITVIIKLSNFYNINKEMVIDLAFWMIINGIVGARLYHVMLEYSFYLNNPLNVFKLWQGGLAIHGGIIAGFLTLAYYTKKHRQNFWQLASIIAPGLALAQAIGRWGNYFNQELFGWPTSLPWGIPINLANRPDQFLEQTYFHPTFLYESLGNALIFFGLIIFHLLLIKKIKAGKPPIVGYKLLVISYLIMYSLLRLTTEFIRIDRTPDIFNLRFPQTASLLIIFLCVFYLFYQKLAKRRQA